MRMPRFLRLGLIAVGAIIVLAVGAGAIFLAQFDPDSLKPRIQEAVKRATGRDLQLNGAIGLKFSLSPAVHIADVVFANPPGFSRPAMATLEALDLQPALIPLLSGRFQIDRLVLIHPDILLETDAAGHPNWEMQAEAPSAAPAPDSAARDAPKSRTVVSIDTVRIQDGLLAYRDDRTKVVTTLAVPKLEAIAASPDAPVHLDMDATYDATPFNLAGDAGPLTRLQDPAATSPWPVNLVLTAAGARLSADGTLTRPTQGKGYDLTVHGTVPDLAALTPLLRGFVPPPLHDVTFAARIADAGGKMPAVSSLTLHVGASDLGATMPGLTVDSLNVAATADQPVKLDAAAKLGGAPLTVAATAGPLASLLPGAATVPFPVDLTIQAAGQTLIAKGSVADIRAGSGANIAIAANIPDLAALSPLAGTSLPALKALTVQTTITDAAGGFRNGAILHGLTVTGPNGDLAAEASVGLGARTSLTAVVKSARIDLDAIQTAIDQAPTPPAQPAPASTLPPKHANRLFSDRKLPFAELKAADADIRLDIATLRSGGADYKGIGLSATLANARLTVDPFAADTPGGRLSGTLSVDASQPAPPVHLVLHAPGLALKSLLVLAHQPSVASGNLEVHADVKGAGDTPHAIAGSLDGSIGMALAGGTVDNRLLGSLLGKVMDSLNAMDLVGKGGSSELRCFAVLMESRRGVGTVQPLALVSSLLTMTGSGTVNLGTETLAMELRPQARIAGTGVVIPMDVSGSITDPRVAVNRISTIESNAGSVAGAIAGAATPLGLLGGVIGADRLGGGGADVCPAALAMARGQTPPAPVAAAKEGKPLDPAALLKNLFK